MPKAAVLLLKSGAFLLKKCAFLLKNTKKYAFFSYPSCLIVTTQPPNHLYFYCDSNSVVVVKVLFNFNFSKAAALLKQFPDGLSLTVTYFQH